MRRTLVAYSLLGVALWPVPLLNVLQVESAAVVALVSYFVAGTAATQALRQAGDGLGKVLLRQEAALLVPLGMLMIAQLWAPNCALGQGLLFYALFPGITVAFAVGLSYLLTAGVPAWAGGVHVAIGVGIVLVGPLYDLGLHPQFYTYNHVFGGVLGPIYDKQLAVRDGLFAFRGLTLLWTGAAVLGGRLLRGHSGAVPLALCLGAIGGAYAAAGSLGINTTPETLRSGLGGHHQTAHFDLYYDPTQLDSSAVAALAADHEAHYRYLRNRLDIDPTQGQEPRIQSYLYPNPDTKGRLTGARTTSVAPVWLAAPQVHLLTRRAEASLGHELAHVLARPYVLPGLRASWAPGLVEGWAVALEPPRPDPSPHDLVNVAHATDSVQALQAPARALATRLSPWGFWTGQGPISYATMGSFVDYLLRAYGPSRLKQVYAWADFQAVYGQSLPALAREWWKSVRGQPLVSIAAREEVARRFTQPSLFGTTCPHHVPPAREYLQAARQALRRGDTTAASDQLHRALARASELDAAHALLADIRLAEGRPGAVRRQLDTLATPLPAVLHVRLGDAFALTGQPSVGRKHYAEARAAAPRHAHETRGRLMLRDAVADRQAVLRVLTSADSAARQARRLAGLSGSPAVRAWRVVRHVDAHQYAAADSLWAPSVGPVRPKRPRAWKQAWGVQWRAWGAEAARRAGSSERARRIARYAARRARALGASDWARAFRSRPVQTRSAERRGLRHRACSLRTRRGRAGSQVATCFPFRVHRFLAPHCPLTL